MLQRVTLKNFKSFRDSTFPVSAFTLVLGANGAGKSNFFDALRLLRFLAAGTSVRDAIEGHASTDPTGIVVPGIRGGGKGLPYFGSQQKTFELEAVFRTADDEITYWICIDADRYTVQGEKLTSRKHPGTYVFSTEDNPPDRDADAPGLPAQYYTRSPGRNPRTEFSPSVSILSQFEARRANSKLNEDVADAARRELQGIRPLEIQPDVLRRYSPLSVFELGEHGENFPAVVWMLRAIADSPREEDAGNAAGQLAQIEAWLGELTPHPIGRIDTVRAPTNEVLFAVLESPFEEITARSLSDGTLRFAALAVALYARPLPTPTPPRLFVIEELENGINPARMQLLVRMIEAATANGHDAQVIASTHSPSLLNWASEATIDSALAVGWNASTESSTVVRLTDIPDFKTAISKAPIGELQAEGWIEFAANTP
jgi:predicted ATPase